MAFKIRDYINTLFKLTVQIQFIEKIIEKYKTY